MLALGRETGDDLCQLNGHLWQIDVAFEQGSLAEVARILEQVARDAEVVGGPLARWQFLRAQAALAQAQARFPDAHRLIGQAHQVIEATGHPFDYATRVSLLAMTGHHVGHGESGSGSLLVGGLSRGVTGTARNSHEGNHRHNRPVRRCWSTLGGSPRPQIVIAPSGRSTRGEWAR